MFFSCLRISVFCEKISFRVNFAKIAQILFYFHVSHQTLSVFAKIFTNAKLLGKQVFRNNFHIKEIFSQNLSNSHVINNFVKNYPFVSHVCNKFCLSLLQT